MAVRFTFFEHLFGCRQIASPSPAKLPPFPAANDGLVKKLEYFRAITAPINATDREVIRLRRDHLYDDAFSAIMSANTTKLRNGLKVEYCSKDGENANDEGGPSKEMMLDLSHEILKPSRSLLFTNSRGLVELSWNATAASAEFLGRLIGLALLHDRIIDINFMYSLFDTLLKRPATRDDLRNLEPQLYTQLQNILNPRFSVNDLGLTFEINDANSKFELKEDGSSIAVTDENKAEYVQLYMEHRINTLFASKSGAQNMVRGFRAIVPQSASRVFSKENLYTLIVGNMKISISAWFAVTAPGGVDPGASPIVQSWFWNYISRIANDNEQLKKVLIFATGSPRVPHDYFVVNITPGGNDRLPVAHTCSKTIHIPSYDNEQRFVEKFVKAIDGARGFDEGAVGDGMC